MVDEENAVEMVDFVLECLRENASTTALEFIARSITCLYGRLGAALCFSVDVAHRKASFVHGRALLRKLYEIRIDEYAEVCRTCWFSFSWRRHHAVIADEKDAVRNAHLWRSDSDTIECCIEGVSHVSNDARKRWGAKKLLRNGFRVVPEDRIILLEYRQDCHVGTIPDIPSRAHVYKRERPV